MQYWCPEHVSTFYGKACLLAVSVSARRGTKRYMKMHMKHEHGDAHLCVCVGWMRVMWGGGKPEEEYPPHPSCFSSALLKEGGKQMLHSPPAAEYSYACFHLAPNKDNSKDSRQTNRAHSPERGVHNFAFSEPAETRQSRHEPVQAWELDGGKCLSQLLHDFSFNTCSS